MSFRRPRSFRETRRSTPNREPYDVVLIVCEGQKTEPSYFRSLIKELRLSSANVKIVGEECGSSPATLVDFAVDELAASDGYDRVFCVFDRDSHPDFEKARDRCHSLRQKKNGKVIPFEAITSNPCFEYWLLLHLLETFKPYAATGSKSVGDLVLRELKVLLKDYQKGNASTFDRLREGLDLAIQRAKRGRQMDLENPSTNVDVLVEYLREVRRAAK